MVLMQSVVGPTYGQDESTWLVSYEMRLSYAGTNSSYAPELANLSASIVLSGPGFWTSIPVEGNLSAAHNITGTAEIEAGNAPNYANIDDIWVGSPVYIVSLYISQRYYGLYDWEFTRDGSGYRFSTIQRSYRGWGFEVTGSDYSSVMVIANDTTRQVHVDVNLMMARATLVALNFSDASAFMGQISFGIPTSFMLSTDGSLAMLPPWLNATTLPGSYVVSLPALPTATTVTIPISVEVSTAEASGTTAGGKLLADLAGTASTWLQQDEQFFRETLLDDSETMGRISEAMTDLVESEQLRAAGDVVDSGFLLTNALRLAAETREARDTAMFYSIYVIAPVVISFLLVVAALVSHLAFNGKTSYVVGIFLALLAVSFLCHPALRIYAVSVGIDAKSIPSIVATVVLLGAASFLVFKRAGAQTVYGLAFSTSLRMIKARKLRGFLSLLAVVVVATSVVPSVTLQGTSQVLASQISAEATRHVSWAYSTWAVKVQTPGGETVREGLRPLQPGEASYLASAASLGAWTTLSVAKGVLSVGDKSVTGTFVVADIAKLVDMLGLQFQQLDSNLSSGVLILGDVGVGPASAVAQVNGRQVRVVGLVSSESLLAPKDEMLSDFLLNTPVMTGGLSMSGASARPIGGPLLGVVDSKSALALGLSLTDLAVVGELGSTSIDQTAAELQSVTMANRDWLTYTNGQAQIHVEVVLSYEFDISAGSSASSVCATLPTTVAAGNWGAQLILMGIGGLIVMNVVMNSVVERRREAITFSSIGASPSFVTNLFIAEGVTLGALGGSIGYALGYAASAWLGVSSTAIKAELYTLTPLILVLVVSILTASLGSILPARSAILQIVPSREILKKEVGEIRFDPSGNALINLPIRIRSWQWKKFSEFLQNLVSPPITSFAYGLWITEYKKVNSVDRLIADYTAYGGALAERKVTYDVDVRPISMGEFDGVELKVSGHPEWTGGHKMLLKEMLYALKDRLIRYTVDRTEIEETPEEEIEEIEAQLARMRAERGDLSKSLSLLDRGILALEEKEAELREKMQNSSPA